MTTEETVDITVDSPFHLRLSLPLADNDTDHWTCCLDGDITLCGKDASNLIWDLDVTQASCNICQEAWLFSFETDMCPLFPNFQCPPEKDES
jgi:hypothetical protein